MGKGGYNNAAGRMYRKGDEGCYVATCVYGSYDCPEYYAVSPSIVKWFGDKDWFRSFFRARLDRMVNNLQKRGFSSEQYNDIEW